MYQRSSTAYGRNEASLTLITDDPKASAVEAVEITADHNFGEGQVKGQGFHPFCRLIAKHLVRFLQDNPALLYIGFRVASQALPRCCAREEPLCRSQIAGQFAESIH
jgi:hypothetical protein